jgi:RecJ-like exonuclease
MIESFKTGGRMKTVEICSECGQKGKGYHIHHKNREHSDNRAENRCILCPSCHSKEHAGEFADISDHVPHDSYMRMIGKSTKTLMARLYDGFEMLQDDEVLSEIY